jgi:hypothetical protein
MRCIKNFSKVSLILWSRRSKLITRECWRVSQPLPVRSPRHKLASDLFALLTLPRPIKHFTDALIDAKFS